MRELCISDIITDNIQTEISIAIVAREAGRRYFVTAKEGLCFADGFYLRFEGRRTWYLR